MSRHSQSARRVIIGDRKYNDVLITRFLNTLMLSGQKAVAEQIFYGCLNTIAEKTKQDPIEIFRKAVDNVKPTLEVKSRRVGGANYQVPVEVRSTRREALSMRWIIGNARSRTGKSMQDKLSEELIDAYNKRGASIRKRDDVHKMAEANKAFAHYRW
jgi:small subunit ribosomal protein S7